ncbi:transcriptional regulator, RpiR family [Kribbella flavida DSM 17836]|uniref:Transcriptional regulator, RpiR family n=1 Tax=Kribbella flavida (strain DSM 17836 / JCM 10339 / NBRC 14399) TaxID=479435 RepID=D2PSH8_KRIFD|nr:MurR/RpiR family transcriptional regulator [Kribbella flavida]ADB33116.1 transcriptional regulator, RpiR family [Kribbella flavida DSM 17836]
MDDPGFLTRLRAEQPGLSGALGRIAAALLAEPGEAARLTITELAERTGTSPGTVTRFCRTLRLAGFAELKVALAEEVGRAAPSRWSTDIGRSIEPADELDQVLKVIVGANTQALLDTADQLDLGAVDEAARAISDARAIHLFGVGTSGITADELRIRLHRIGFACWVWPELHSALVSVALADRRDVVIGISHSGQIAETIAVLRAAAARGARTIAITNDATSALAGEAGLVLATAQNGSALTTVPPGGAGSSQADALADRHSQFLVLDVLYTRVAQLNHARTLAALETTAAAIDPYRAPRPRRRRTPPS